MIEIESANLYERWNKYPRIDFKFQNTGDATALLYKFGIEVRNLRIDPAPALSFVIDYWSEGLVVTVTNNGWGPAHDIQITLEESQINALWGRDERSCSVALLPSGESQVLRIPLQTTKPVTAQLQAFTVAWTCSGEPHHEGRDHAKTVGGGISLYRGRFSGQQQQQQQMQMQITTTFVEVLRISAASNYDVDLPTSLAIPPGDVERFQVVVAAEQSCRVDLRFKFWTDAKVILSEPFEVSIWNPRNDPDYIYFGSSHSAIVYKEGRWPRSKR